RLPQAQPRAGNVSWYNLRARVQDTQRTLSSILARSVPQKGTVIEGQRPSIKAAGGLSRRHRAWTVHSQPQTPANAVAAAVPTSMRGMRRMERGNGRERGQSAERPGAW